MLRGGPGWVLPLAESRQTAAVLDAGPRRGLGRSRCPRGPIQPPRRCSPPDVAEQMGTDVVHVRTLLKEGKLLGCARRRAGSPGDPGRAAWTASEIVKHLVPVLTLLARCGLLPRRGAGLADHGLREPAGHAAGRAAREPRH